MGTQQRSVKFTDRAGPNQEAKLGGFKGPKSSSFEVIEGTHPIFLTSPILQSPEGWISAFQGSKPWQNCSENPKGTHNGFYSEKVLRFKQEREAVWG